MGTFERSKALLDKFKEDDRVLQEKIQAITLQIRAHRQNDRRNTENDVKDPEQRRYYHWWLKVSFRLHRQRAVFKSMRMAVQENIHELTIDLKVKFESKAIHLSLLPATYCQCDLISFDHINQVNSI